MRKCDDGGKMGRFFLTVIGENNQNFVGRTFGKEVMAQMKNPGREGDSKWFPFGEIGCQMF